MNLIEKKLNALKSLFVIMFQRNLSLDELNSWLKDFDYLVSEIRDFKDFLVNYMYYDDSDIEGLNE